MSGNWGCCEPLRNSTLVHNKPMCNLPITDRFQGALFLGGVGFLFSFFFDLVVFWGYLKEKYINPFNEELFQNSEKEYTCCSLFLGVCFIFPFYLAYDILLTLWGVFITCLVLIMTPLTVLHGLVDGLAVGWYRGYSNIDTLNYITKDLYGIMPLGLMAIGYLPQHLIRLVFNIVGIIIEQVFCCGICTRDRSQDRASASKREGHTLPSGAKRKSSQRRARRHKQKEAHGDHAAGVIAASTTEPPSLSMSDGGGGGGGEAAAAASVKKSTAASRRTRARSRQRRSTADGEQALPRVSLSPKQAKEKRRMPAIANMLAPPYVTELAELDLSAQGSQADASSSGDESARSAVLAGIEASPPTTGQAKRDSSRAEKGREVQQRATSAGPRPKSRVKKTDGAARGQQRRARAPVGHGTLHRTRARPHQAVPPLQQQPAAASLQQQQPPPQQDRGGCGVESTWTACVTM